MTHTLPTLAQRTPAFTVVYWGTGGTGTGTILGQVQSFQWQEAITNKEAFRVGDSTRYRSYLAKDITWQLTMYEDSDFQEIGLLMGGGARPTSGWVGSEDMTLDLVAGAGMMTVANFATEATDSALLWLETLSSVKVDNATRQVTAGTEDNMWQFSGIAATLIVEPTALV